jgi:hypothetical protein
MSDLVIVRPDQSAEALHRKIEAAPGPSRVVAGTGGKMLRWPDGHVTGPIDGEALRGALNRGAVVIAEKSVQLQAGPSVTAQKNEAAADLKERESFVGANYVR